jgi:hypothetical protein
MPGTTEGTCSEGCIVSHGSMHIYADPRPLHLLEVRTLATHGARTALSWSLAIRPRHQLCVSFSAGLTCQKLVDYATE